jgi:hypothetical protein
VLACGEKQRCFGYALLLEPRNYAAVVGMVGVLLRRRALRSQRETRRLAEHFLRVAFDTWPRDRYVSTRKRAKARQRGREGGGTRGRRREREREEREREGEEER